MEKNKQLEIKVSILKIIYNATLPIYYRLNCLLEDFFHKNVALSETDAALLMEYCSCAGTLKVLFEEYFEKIPNASPEEKLMLPYEEYMTIMTLSKTVELSTRTVLGGLTIQEH